MNKSTVPAPFETPSPRPGCPYECLRLGVGLRFQDAARLTFLVVATALLAVACGGAVDPTPEPVVALVGAEPSCEVSGGTDTEGRSVWVFDAPVANPDPADCESLGDRYYLCAPVACTALPYAGTCAHCGGGGE